MPCFVCTKCECIENTACGDYWSCSKPYYKDDAIEPEFIGKPLCSECAPEEYLDGTKTGWGKWHGRFPKQHWSVTLKEKPEGYF